MREGEVWLRFAKEDLRVAELALQDGLYNQVCFHAQQCVEKSLKGWLAYQDASIPRTHRMADLLPLVSADFIVPIRDRLLFLDQFYIPTRYPDALPGLLSEGLPTQQDAGEALELAKQVFELVWQCLIDDLGE